MNINEITGKVIGAALKVHALLGPGLFEVVYKTALKREVELLGLNVASEVPIPVIYDQIVFECGYRADLLVESLVMVEVKAVEQVSRLHRHQLLTYLKMCNRQVGLLINFNTPYLTQGIHRLVNRYTGPLPSLQTAIVKKS